MSPPDTSRVDRALDTARRRTESLPALNRARAEALVNEWCPPTATYPVVLPAEPDRTSQKPLAGLRAIFGW